MARYFFLHILILICFPLVLRGGDQEIVQEGKITVSGYITDASNGEILASVTVADTRHKTGTMTNSRGFYSIALPVGSFELQFSYIGYKSIKKSGTSQKNFTLDISLDPAETNLGEILVEAKRADANVSKPVMSMVELDAKTIRAVPSLLGEVDLVRVIQLLPGVQTTSEGSTGFSVRGGTADQNLILIDEATVYNASHLMGFFSVFNNDAVDNVTLYKGDLPAAYGGRLSSLLDVRMKDGDPRKFGFTGSIGTVSSKLTIDGPLIKDRTTFLVGGRRTYADLFLPFAKDEDVRDNKLYFYDLNLKLSHKINERNRLYFSGYTGRDIFKNQFSEVGFGNNAAAIRWNHIISGKLFFNLNLIWSRYNYDLGTADEGSGSFSWISDLSDYSIRFDLTHYLSDRHKLRYGSSFTFYKLSPGKVTGLGSGTGISEFILPSSASIGSSLYLSDDVTVTDKLTLKLGLRFISFSNAGPATIYNFDQDYNPVDSSVYGRGSIFHTYPGIEPRIAFIYLLNEKSSVKGSYSHSSQYLTLAQNSTAGTPLDIWFPASPNVKPQVCDQFAAGYFRNLKKNMYEASAEIYYKDLRKLIDFRDHAQLFLNQYLEGELRFGDGYSYGIESIIRKNEGRLTGWLSYTYSRSFRIVPEINNGRRYVSPYDKPNNLNVVLNYELSKRWVASATWIYASGLPVTFPTGKAMVGNAIIPIYSDRNSYRMEDYHRLDLSVTLRGKIKPQRSWQSEFNFSVYNAYNRHNAWAINFVQDPADPYITYAEKTYLFAVIPSLTYTIRFRQK
jgi:CarboxypepD_reg-like domain/TonB-dependent Receptor Plug Domain